MMHPLTQERKGSSPIAHSLNELQFVHFSFDDPIASRHGQTSLDHCFVLHDSGHKALQLAYPACFDTGKPLVELLACTRP